MQLQSKYYVGIMMSEKKKIVVFGVFILLSLVAMTSIVSAGMSIALVEHKTEETSEEPELSSKPEEQTEEASVDKKTSDNSKLTKLVKLIERIRERHASSNPFLVRNRIATKIIELQEYKQVKTLTASPISKINPTAIQVRELD